jgi:hypothetical protein
MLLYIALLLSPFLCSNGDKLGIAGLNVLVSVFVPVNVLVVIQLSERLSWAPPASLHF